MEDNLLTDRGGGRFWDVSSAVHLLCTLFLFFFSLVAPLVKSLPTVWETRVQSVGGEDLLEKEMTAHSTEEFNGLRSLVGYKGLDTSE